MARTHGHPDQTIRQHNTEYEMSGDYPNLYTCDAHALSGLTVMQFSTRPLTGKCVACGAPATNWYCNVYEAARALILSRATPEPEAWRPIETAPKEALALFWIVAGPGFFDTSGNRIAAMDYKPNIQLTKYGRWSSLCTATHWMPLPSPPTGAGT
jgi:hypothetical protein